MIAVLTQISPPNCLSAAVDLAIGDLRKTMAMPDVYAVHMGHWHTPPDSNFTDVLPSTPCNVCFAGAVMAQTLKLPVRDYVSGPEDFDGPWGQIFGALNAVRTGDLIGAYATWPEGWLAAEEHVEQLDDALARVLPFSVDPKLFLTRMGEISAQLKEIGT
jgi:hypothetical protein